MPGRLHKRVLPLLILAAVLFLSGCNSVGVVPVGPGPASGKPVAANKSVGPQHDLAVISLDFNPPIRVLQVDQVPKNLKLLVAVDNLGGFTERKVGVTVDLRAEVGSELLFRKQKTVESIAPGEVTVVKVGDFPSIPPRSGYTLVVTVDTVPGETNTTDNSMVLPLQSVLFK